MFAGLHASDIGLMNSKPLGKLPLGETMLGTEVRDLNGQPAGEGGPLPLRTELGVTKVLRKNILMSYELIGHLLIPFR
jgi:hypothetical protein